MKTILTAGLMALTLAAGPAMAVVDGGDGCGCIRPCHIINR